MITEQTIKQITYPRSLASCDSVNRRRIQLPNLLCRVLNMLSARLLSLLSFRDKLLNSFAINSAVVPDPIELLSTRKLVPEQACQKRQTLDLSQILHDTCWR